MSLGTQHTSLLMTTTLKVTKGTNAHLEKYKSDHGFKSKDEVIQHLLGLSADNVDAVPAGSDEDDGMDGVDDDVPKGKLAQGIFYASLGNDAKSVKHFTGLNDSVYQWVRQQLTQAVRKTLFFLFSLVRATSCMANAVVLHL